jgi:hypothetical protein
MNTIQLAKIKDCVGILTEIVNEEIPLNSPESMANVNDIQDAITSLSQVIPSQPATGEVDESS